MIFSIKIPDRTETSLTTLNNSEIERVELYKYLGIWLEWDLSYRYHVTNLIDKIKPKIAFLFRSKSCFSRENRQKIVQATLLPILDYGDILYMNAPATILNSINTIYHSALRFITGAGFRTHHCLLYQALDWPSLELRRKQHGAMFIY